jgi:hypothetical protein
MQSKLNIMILLNINSSKRILEKDLAKMGR